jgi:N-methylhydantoinase B
MTTTTSRKTDPIQYEILRHRLQSATEEAAVTMKRVSGSPVATEIGDLNVSIMDDKGDCVLLGQYSIAKGTTLSKVVKDILNNYQDNPGIHEGDAFICNDPYVGVMHQNDVALVMPYFRDGRLLAWVGAEIHQVDVGGPTPGQVQLGAKDIFGEAPLMPPMKILQNGKLLKDVERNYLRKSRVPDLVALDLRAKLAACNGLCHNIELIADQLGSDGLLDFFEDILNDAERLIRAKLRNIPNGTWYSRAYMEFEDKVYPIVVSLTKDGERMIFDFTGTAKQAPATINMTFESLEAHLCGSVVTSLCWDIPWTTGGISRVIEIRAEEGTLVRPTYPAGVSKSTTSIGLLMGSVVRLAISKMLLASGIYADRAMAGWPGSKAQEELHGINQYGQHFGADILDGMAGGGGARTWKDGIDTGGLGGSPKVGIANVEDYEQQYPLLYLYRRQLPDSGGAGMFRGGNGIDRMYIVHDQEEIPDVVMHSIGSKVPATAGLAGGHPAATNQFMIKRATNIEEELGSGKLLTDFDQVDAPAEYHGAMSRTSLRRGDVYRSISNGGGGYGDPLHRHPDLVAEDLRLGRISEDTARELYGVVIRDGEWQPEETAALRAQLRRERLARAVKPEASFSQVPVARKHRHIHDLMYTGLGTDGHPYYYCNCGCTLAAYEDDYLKHLPYRDAAFRETGKHVDPREIAGGEFYIRLYYCPDCGTQLNSEIMRKGDAPLPGDRIELSFTEDSEAAASPVA